MKSVNNNTYSLENAMSEFFSKLDEVIDDMEEGRELSFEDAFQKINELRRFRVL